VKWKYSRNLKTRHKHTINRRSKASTDHCGHSCTLAIFRRAVAIAFRFRLLGYAIFDYGKRQYSILSIFPAPPPWTAFNQTWSSFVVFHYCQCHVCPAHYRSVGHHPLLFRIHFSILHSNNHFLHNVPSVAVHSVLELKKIFLLINHCLRF